MPAKRPLRVILIQPRNPMNIGGVARAMGNFGVSDLVVVDPYEPVWRETRSAPEAESVVLNARLASTWQEAVQDCTLLIGTSSFHRRLLEGAVIELPNFERFLSSYPASTPVALIFGSERSGLSNDELGRCQAILRIPTQRDVPSMNLAQAAAVVLYEWRRLGWEAPLPSGPAVSSESESLIESLAQLGAAVDYPPGYEPAARVGRLRQALQNATLPPATVRYLLSLSRWLLKKHPPSS